jgi:type II secretory pathway component PulM
VDEGQEQEPKMSESPPRFAPLQRVRDYLEGLSSRERTLLTTLGVVLGLVVVLGFAYTIYDRIDTLEENNEAMHSALRDIEKQRGPYLAARARAAQLDARIGQTPLQLSGFLEQISKETNLEIRETNPRTPEAAGKKYIQQSVDLRISKVALEPLLKFMRRLETYQQNLVLVTQLSIRARDDKHQDFEVDMTVSTYENAPKTAAKPSGTADKKADGADKETP